jgi:hypothetical protein
VRSDPLEDPVDRIVRDVAERLRYEVAFAADTPPTESQSGSSPEAPEHPMGGDAEAARMHAMAQDAAYEFLVVYQDLVEDFARMRLIADIADQLARGGDGPGSVLVEADEFRNQLGELHAALELASGFMPDMTPGSRELPELAAPSSEVAAKRLVAELQRLIGTQSMETATLERAARIVAAEQSWREGLGLLLDEDDVARLLGIDRTDVANLSASDDAIVLRSRDGSARYPAYQFQEGRLTPALARAHRTLVESGYLSPWSAASWARTSHPELESCSPAQWAGERRDDDRLLLVAARDAARAAQ